MTNHNFLIKFVHTPLPSELQCIVHCIVVKARNEGYRLDSQAFLNKSQRRLAFPHGWCQITSSQQGCWSQLMVVSASASLGEERVKIETAGNKWQLTLPEQRWPKNAGWSQFDRLKPSPELKNAIARSWVVETLLLFLGLLFSVPALPFSEPRFSAKRLQQYGLSQFPSFLDVNILSVSIDIVSNP